MPILRTPESLHQVIPQHEVEFIQTIVETLRSLGVPINDIDFIDSLLSDIGYVWDQDTGYMKSKTFDPGLPNRSLIRFVEQLGGQRRIDQLWAIKDTHELFYAVWFFDFARQGQVQIDPLTFIDAVASHTSLTWNVGVQSYIHV